MTTDRWQRVQDLFERAEPVPVAERSALLASLCDDESIRAEVASLLEHSEAAPDRFMRPPPAAEGAGAPVEDPLIGTQVGCFHIERVLGAGGMGTVYLATQDNPRRKAAVKVLRPAFAAPQALRRFEFESRVLAHLSHPNIAHVYEAGVHRLPPSGLSAPYFAMEYIPDAKPITTYAREKGLSVRQRLELFEQVCGAVHHGHQKGIIHRDLKPGNILVDAAGVPKVIDFGVARGTDADLAITTVQTDAGQLIGTLQYMSPEQCDADPLGIDTRSDVYSLGVVLYELLADRLPYETAGTSIYAATRIIRESKAPRLSTIHRRFRGDLELIVDKAVRKDREGRYASAAGLQRDIRSFLDGAPIEARPPTRVGRIINWSRRHPRAATGIACGAFVATVLLTLWITVRLAHLEPYRVDLSRDRRKATLLSWSENVLFNWGGAVPDAIEIAEELLERPDGSGPLAILGFKKNYPSPFAGMLCAFDARRPSETEPVWCRGVGAEDVPPNDRPGFTWVDFGVANVKLLNVFESIPGYEVVAKFYHEYSYRAIQIYAYDGRLLYQFWNHGDVFSCASMPKSELLIVTAEIQDDYDKGRWSKYDAPHADSMGKQTYPLAVFALPLREGFNSNRLVKLSPHVGAEPPVWVRVLQPSLGSAEVARLELKPPLKQYADGRHLLLSFSLHNEAAGVERHIDESGQLVDSFMVSESFYDNLKVPSLSDLAVGDLPPRLPTADGGP